MMLLDPDQSIRPSFFLLLPFFSSLLLLFGANLDFSVAVPSGHCPQWVNDEIQQCVQPVAEFAKTLNQQQMEQTPKNHSTPSSEFGQALQWPAKMGGQVFRELCRLISDFELCVEGHRDKCRRHITIGLIEASYGFLCNEGYETFMASAECLMELDQKPSVKRCHDRTLKDIEDANNEQSEVIETKLDKMCSALNFFSDCVRAPIRLSCGVQAWRVIFRVLKDTTRTLMPMCHFEEEGEEGSEEGGSAGGDKLMRNSGRRRQHHQQQQREEASGKTPTIIDDSSRNGKMPEKGPSDGGWEEWEEDEDRDGTREEEEVQNGIGDESTQLIASSHQIHYGSQIQPSSGVMTRDSHWRCWPQFFFSLISLCCLYTMYTQIIHFPKD